MSGSIGVMVWRWPIWQTRQAPRPATTSRLRLSTDNGSQYIQAQFTQYLSASRLPHGRTRAGHPQSNRKYDRWKQTATVECVRRMALGDRDDPGALAALIERLGEDRSEVLLPGTRPTGRNSLRDRQIEAGETIYRGCGRPITRSQRIKHLGEQEIDYHARTVRPHFSPR